MKKLLTILLCSCFYGAFAQAPQGINYQAVIRDASGNIISNQAIGLKVSILQGSPSGTIVYDESFAPTTSQLGLVNVVIGEGTIISGDFASIDWSAGPYFAEISADETGGTNYTLLGTQQLMSVPYALHAQSAENVINDQVDDADNDPANELQDWTSLPGVPNMLRTMQSGNQLIGANPLELSIIPVTFPTAFANIPMVFCQANTEIGSIYDDSFNITIREVTTTGFVMIVNRVDGSNWGQNLSANWMAFEP